MNGGGERITSQIRSDVFGLCGAAADGVSRPANHRGVDQPVVSDTSRIESAAGFVHRLIPAVPHPGGHGGGVVS